MRKTKHKRRARWVSIALALLVGGCSTAPQFRLFQESAFSFPPPTPVRLFLEKEVDMGSGYWEKVEFFELPKARDLLVQELNKPVLRYMVSEPAGNRVWKAEIPNCFLLVDGEESADFVLSIGIEKLAYGDAQDAQKEYATYAALGVFGLVISGTGPRGYVVVNAKVVERGSDKLLHSFQVGGVSDTRRQKPEALREAMLDFAENFNTGLLRR